CPETVAAARHDVEALELIRVELPGADRRQIGLGNRHHGTDQRRRGLDRADVGELQQHHATVRARAEQLDRVRRRGVRRDAGSMPRARMLQVYERGYRERGRAIAIRMKTNESGDTVGADDLPERDEPLRGCFPSSFAHDDEHATRGRSDPTSSVAYLSSTISNTTFRLVRDAAAFKIVRIDLAVRPC